MYDYHITTSDQSSRIIATDSLVRFSKMRPLGFPRNDIFYNSFDRSGFKTEIERKIGFSFDKIICYTPTFRDYERKDLKLYNEEYVKKHSIWGLEEYSGEKEINEVLKKYSAIIIAKLHPWQTKEVIESEEIGDSRVFSFYDLFDDHSLYEVLACSDILITDYTSTSFDFMHLNRPIVYYFYDYLLYLSNRGFSYDPIQSICGGHICYSFNDLICALAELLSGIDLYYEKRDYIHTLLNKHHDGYSSARIKDFIKSIA